MEDERPAQGRRLSMPKEATVTVDGRTRRRAVFADSVISPADGNTGQPVLLAKSIKSTVRHIKSQVDLTMFPSCGNTVGEGLITPEYCKRESS